MVHLVLQTHGQQASQLFIDDIAVAIERLYRYRLWSLDGFTKARFPLLAGFSAMLFWQGMALLQFGAWGLLGSVSG